MFRFGSRKHIRAEYGCTIRFLDDEEPPLHCDYRHVCLGQYILDFVCSSIGLLEKDHFGLRYVDTHNQRQWLDLSKPVVKQVKGIRNVVFCFRVKYYPANPLDLQEETCKHQVYLQLKRDLSHGRLNCTQSEAAFLIACIKQAEIGRAEIAKSERPLEIVNAGEEDEEQNFVEKLLPKYSQAHIDNILRRVETIHDTIRDLTSLEAQEMFLKRASALQSYGIDPHPVKDEHNNQMYIGMNHMGVLTFKAGKRDLHIRFDDLVKFNYEGRMFILHVQPAGSDRRQVLGFRCTSQAACHYLYQCANDIRCYFTSIPPQLSKRNTLSRAMSILKKRDTFSASMASLPAVAPPPRATAVIEPEPKIRGTDMEIADDSSIFKAEAIYDPPDMPFNTPKLDGSPTKYDTYAASEMNDATLPMTFERSYHSECGSELHYSSSILRHAQMFALTSFVMFLVLSVGAIAVMESDSTLLEEVKSWPPMVILRREYYHPMKNMLSGQYS